MRTDPTDSHDPHRAPNGAAIQVLVVSHEAARRRSVEAALLGLVAAVSGVADLPGPDACGHFDVVLIDAAALGEHLGSTLLVPAGTALVVVGGERDAADLRAAMRLGAHDVADHGLAGSVLLERVLGACAVARSRAGRVRSDGARLICAAAHLSLIGPEPSLIGRWNGSARISRALLALSRDRFVMLRWRAS
jgi:hypothetical protein